MFIPIKFVALAAASLVIGVIVAEPVAAQVVVSQPGPSVVIGRPYATYYSAPAPMYEYYATPTYVAPYAPYIPPRVGVVYGPRYVGPAYVRPYVRPYVAPRVVAPRVYYRAWR